MWRHTGSKRFFTSCLSLSLVFIILFSGFPVAQLAEVLSERKIVDSLYLARTLNKVVDNFSIQEARANPGTRVRTVEFFAGQDAGSATNKNQNQKQNFASQTYSLAESSADVIDAYVEVSAEIGGTAATTYGSAFIYFDSCVPSCTPSTVAFTTTAGLGTNSAEAQTIRFRASVTAEDTLAAYTGGGANRTFQVSYCFATSTSCSGTTAANIQGANAKLVITYTYDDTSATQTNTVVYPLESASETGSRTAAQASCTVDSNCPTFSYNADVPEVSSQLSQWFYLQTSLNGNSTTDWQTVSDIGSGANTSAVFFEEALQNNGGWVNWMHSGVAGYANNTAVTDFEVSTNGSNVYALGGENYVTYTYANSAATKTKTVVLPVGQVITAAADANKSALTGPTVFIPETGVDVKKAWFRVHTSMGGNTTAGTLGITTKIGGNAETGATSYSLAADTQGVSDDGYFVHLIPSTDYAELEAATASSGKAVQMTAQWTANARGAVSGELVITYQYTGEANGYLTTQNLFAGQQTAAPATSYTTATGAINPGIPESTGTVTIRGGSLRMSGKNTGTTANEAMGSNLTTSTCTPSNTSTAVTDSEITRIMFWKDLSSVLTNSEAQTYTACYSSAQSSVFTGILIVTYQWDAPLNVSFTLNDYRWYVDSDSENVTDPWGIPDIAENTVLTPVPVGNDPPGPAQELRLRVNFTVNNASLAVSSKQFKLQYKAGTDESCTSGSWSDVGAGGGGSIWRFATSSVTDGADLTVLKLAASDVLEEYAKSNPTQTNHNSATQGQDIEYDFHIEHNGATDATEYSFRVVESNDTVFDGYNVCPTLYTEPGTGNVLRHGNFFASGAEQGFSWAN